MNGLKQMLDESVDIRDFSKRYFEYLTRLMQMMNTDAIRLFAEEMEKAREGGNTVFVVGNGGSAAIASHFANDLNKTVFGQKGEKRAKRFQAICLADNTPALTAWANDVGFEDVFSEQLKNFAQEKDVLLAISSSGNSPNIIKAVETAKNLHLPVIGLAGFDGGKLLALADAKIHVPSQKYEIIESAHEAICHLITTYFKEVIK